VIATAKRHLIDGDLRLYEFADNPMRGCIPAPFDTRPHIGEITASDYGALAKGDEPVIEQFREEVRAIEDALEIHGIQIPAVEWLGPSEGAAHLGRRMNRRAWAIQLWNWYAVPLRFLDGTVVALWAPDDLEGAPIVRRYAPGSMLAEWSIHLNRREGGRARRHPLLGYVGPLLFCAVLLIFIWLL
jgi:hypothetical protein